jgi:hypothetical protein
VELDHVLVAVPELVSAASELEARHGLASVDGGGHTGWGTANRIVPLGESYLELVAVVDEVEALESAFGRWVAGATAGRPLGWAVRTRELDAVARRLGLAVSEGSRVVRDEEPLRWRTAGISQAAAEPALPFFIEWGEGARHPGRTPVTHPAAPAGIVSLVLQGDPERLATWLGGQRLPIVARGGRPAVAAVVVETAEGEVVLGDPAGAAP